MTTGTDQTEVQRVVMAAQLGRFDEAVRLLAPLLAHDPGNPGLWVLQSGVLQGIEQYAEAYRAAREAVRLDPENGAAHYYLGVSLWNSQVLGRRLIMPAVKKQADRALEHLREAVRLEPHDTDYQVVLAHFLLGRGEKDAADQTLRQVLELDPENTSARLALSQMALDKKDPAQAERYARQVLEQEPESAEAMGVLAWAQMRLKDPVTALITAHDSVRADPANPVTHQFFSALCHAYLPRPLGKESWVWRFALVPHLAVVILPVGVVAVQMTNFLKFAALPPELRGPVRKVRPMTRERWGFGALGLSLLLLIAALFMPNKLVGAKVALASGVILQGLVLFWLCWQVWKLLQRVLGRKAPR